MTHFVLPSTGRRNGMPLAALCGAAAAIAGGYWATAPDAVLFSAFDAAIAAHSRSTPPMTTAVRSAEREGAVLRTTSLDAGAGSGRTFAVGDRLSMHGKDGRDAIYEIVDVHDIDTPASRERTVAGPRLLLVTARPTEAHSALRPLRFVVEADEADTVTPPIGAPRAL